MLRAGSTAVQSRPVVGRAIALVAPEAIGRKSPAEYLHQFIPGHLGDDRGGRDRQYRLISSGNAELRGIQI